MYIKKVQNLLTEARTRIEKVPDDKYRIAMMYSFLTASDVSQVAGKYRPLGKDAKKFTVYIEALPIDLVFFRIKYGRGKKHTVFPFIPLDDAFDPWINIVYSYFQEYSEASPFIFHENVETSKRYLQIEASKVFSGLDYTILYGPRERDEEQSFTLNELKRLRLNDLVLNYGFTALDFALFNGRDEKSDTLSHYIKEIRSENLVNQSSEELAYRAMSYLTKFLKKNDDIDIDILTATQSYFYVYAYDKIINSDAQKDEFMDDLTHILNKDKEYIQNILEQVTELHFSNKVFDYENTSQLEKTYEWFRKNKIEAITKFDDFYHNLKGKRNIKFEEGLKQIVFDDQLFVEEGSIHYSNIKMKKRSRDLLVKSREYFRNKDKEGKLRCQICGYVKPPFVDREIIHIHHLTPLKDFPEEGITTVIQDAIKNTMPLCPTCHSLVHSKENLSIDQIIENLERAQFSI